MNELFAGAGGAFLGGHEAGCTLVEAVELDELAAAALDAGRQSLGADGVVRQESVDDWTPAPATAWWGSPPCQRFSTAGRGKGVDGFPMVFRALDRAVELGCRPSAVLLENVKGMLARRKRWRFEQFLDELADFYPYVGWWLLNSQDFGVPQARQRVIMWAADFPIDEPPPMHWPVHPMGVALGLHGTIDGLVCTTGQTSERAGGRVPHEVSVDRPSPTVRAQQGTGLGLRIIGGGAGNAGPFVVDERGWSAASMPSTTVSASEWRGSCVEYGGRPNRASDKLFVATGRRRLTVEECAILQDFPDGWPFQGSKRARYRQVGNAVPARMAAACWRAVFDGAHAHARRLLEGLL